MSVPKAILDIAKVIKAEVELSPEQNTQIVIPLDNFRDEAGVFVGKSTLDKVLRRLQEKQILKAINLSDLHNHIMPLQSDKVVVEVDRERLNNLLLNEVSESSEQGVDNKQVEISKTQQTTQRLPEGWNLLEVDGEAQINKNDEVIFTFPNLWSDKYLYFKYAWNKYNQVIPYKELFESKPKAEYPDKKGENWQINKAIRITMNKLRKEFEKKKVPITIQTDNGIKVFVSE